MFKKHNPGCPCCGCVCLIDSFDDAVDVSAADSKTIRGNPHPQSPYPAWLRVEVELDPGNVARIFFAWDDSTPGDGFYVEITPQDGATQGTMKLFRKSGVQIGDTFNLMCALTSDGYSDLWHEVTMCYDPDESEVKVIFNAANSRRTGITLRQEIAEDEPSGFAAGRHAGYGTGSGHTGTVSFRNYEFERLWYCDDGDGCTSACTEYDARTVCRTCEDCVVIYEDFDGRPDGDMPCGWDSAGTNWEIVSETATGDGSIFHEFELLDDGYILEVAFNIGAMATDGDSVTVAILGDGKVFSATITRIAVNDYTVAYNQGGGTFNLTSSPEILLLQACPDVVRPGNIILSMLASPIGVSITQPTLAGHVDSSVRWFQFERHGKAQSGCPRCNAFCGVCEYPDLMFADIGPAFLSPRYGSPACESVEGVFALSLTTACNWVYSNGIWYDCHDASCDSKGPHYFRWYLQLQAVVWTSSGGSWTDWTLYLMMENTVPGTGGPGGPTDPCKCAMCTGRWTATQYWGPDCVFAPSGIIELTLAVFSCPSASFAGWECYGTLPSTVRIAMDGTLL